MADELPSHDRPLLDMDEAQQERYAVALQARHEWQSSPYASMPFDEYQDFMAWRRFKANAGAVAEGQAVDATGKAKTVADLTAVFKAHLDYRLKQTVGGLRSKHDLSRARHEQYGFAIDHMNAVVGDTVVSPFGEYAIGERQLTAVADVYRTKCIEQMKAKGYSGHWFNERMKTMRAFIGYLVENRLCDATPPNVHRLTEKYSIAPNAAPIPLNVLRAMYAAADVRVRCYMLVALNCGFRQTEIASMKPTHLKTISGKVCIEKHRGKTGVPIVIPLWNETKRAIDEQADNEGDTLFAFDGGMKSAIDCIGNRWKKIRKQVAKKLPNAAAYSFENLRDTGASYLETVNPMLVPLYLGHGDKRMAKQYVGAVHDAEGNPIVPMYLDDALARLQSYLALQGA